MLEDPPLAGSLRTSHSILPYHKALDHLRESAAEKGRSGRPGEELVLREDAVGRGLYASDF